MLAFQFALFQMCRVRGASCGAGKWESVSDTCSLCNGGNQTQSCTTCSAGKWSNGTGLTADAECELCPNGKYSDVRGLTHKTQCNNCPVGYSGAKFGVLTPLGATYCVSNKPTVVADGVRWINDRFSRFKTIPVYVGQSVFTTGVTFSLLYDPNNSFTVDTFTGEVMFKAMPKHDEQNRYMFTIQSQNVLGNRFVSNVTVHVCGPFETSESQCSENTALIIAKRTSDARKSGFVERTISGDVQAKLPLRSVNPCGKDKLSQMKVRLSVLIEVNPSNINVWCKGERNVKARRLRHDTLHRRLNDMTYTFEYTVVIPGDPSVVESVTVQLNAHETWEDSIAAATGEDAGDIAIVSVKVAIESAPAHRTKTYHSKYTRASRVYRGLRFPIPEGLGMLGEGTVSGTLYLNTEAPMHVHVTNVPSPGVRGCTPLVSFYTQVLDHLLSTLPYSVRQYTSSTGDQQELEGLRVDIENAQKDLHSVKVFCGDLSKALKIRRNVYHAYTSAWASMRFGSGTLSKYGHSVSKRKLSSQHWLAAFTIPNAPTESVTHSDIVKQVLRASETNADVLVEILR